jgi:AraC-like DNA-binding protein
MVDRVRVSTLLARKLNETAYLLGYEDAHSFFRAFHDGDGSPPGEWRARHVQAN